VRDDIDELGEQGRHARAVSWETQVAEAPITKFWLRSKQSKGNNRLALDD
jgi:hypothetical protein